MAGMNAACASDKPAIPNCTAPARVASLTKLSASIALGAAATSEATIAGNA